MTTDPDDLLSLTADPVARLLLCGRAKDLREATELYLNACLPEVIQLLESPLSDEELGRHPLMVMLPLHRCYGLWVAAPSFAKQPTTIRVRVSNLHALGRGHEAW